MIVTSSHRHMMRMPGMIMAAARITTSTHMNAVLLNQSA